MSAEDPGPYADEVLPADQPRDLRGPVAWPGAQQTRWEGLIT